tara:strand:+ start:3267 stop:4076 length:810 start_codon:yes stop_codon:yes gene_type:complete
MKLKHNKKRNTAFLYEALIRTLTSSMVNNRTKEQKIIKRIIKEFFNKDKILKQELDIYDQLLQTKSEGDKACRRLMFEIKKDFLFLDRRKVFNEQTKLIKKINESLSNSFFATFISNYRNIATIGQFLHSDKLVAKQRILLEDTVLKLMNSNSPKKEIKHIDNLTFKTFVDKFNSTYKNTLKEEQKILLTHYITSFSDNELSLKAYMNEEIGRLKNEVSIHINDDRYKEEFEKILDKLNNYGKIPLGEEIIKEVFYIQDLLYEVSTHGA